MQAQDVKYVGFWARFLAFVIDSILVTAVVVPLLAALYGAAYFQELLMPFDVAMRGEHSGTVAGSTGGPMSFLVQWVVPAAAVILFWIYRQATPGKMAVSAKIVDAQTLEPPSTGQLIGRYFAYYVSIFSFGLGFLWIAFDKRKQGWHDKLAGTVVIGTKKRS
ncbi:MAG TPA: RDD family protein [Burkholderiales bacterium]